MILRKVVEVVVLILERTDKKLKIFLKSVILQSLISIEFFYRNTESYSAFRTSVVSFAVRIRAFKQMISPPAPPTGIQYARNKNEFILTSLFSQIFSRKSKTVNLSFELDDDACS